MGSKRLIDRLGFPEAPRWNKGKLWFSDFGERVVTAVDLDGTARQVVEVAARPSGLGWLPDGSLLVVSMMDQRVLRTTSTGTVEHADLSSFTTTACNDMIVDASGNAYVGYMGFDLLASPVEPKHASLILVRCDGSTSEAASDLSFPNGMALTADGRRLIVAETFGRRLTSFDVALDGTLSNRQIFAELPDRAPDGICLDRAGAVWFADARGRACVRVVEGGTITDVIRTERGCYACALGGPDGRTLFLCVADGYAPSSMALRTGSIEMVPVDIPAQ